MAAMMAPSLALMLRREDLGRFTILVAGAYLFVWTLIGYGLAAIDVTYPVWLIVTIGALYQLLVLRVPERRRAAPVDAGSAWIYGVRMGLDCAWRCAGFMAMLLAIGMMNFRAMAVITLAITVNRLAQPKVNEYAATPGSRNSMRSVRS